MLNSKISVVVFFLTLVFCGTSFALTDAQVKQSYNACVAFMKMKPAQQLATAQRTQYSVSQVTASCKFMVARGLAAAIKSEHDYQKQSQAAAAPRSRSVSCSGMLDHGLGCDNGVRCSGLLGGGLSCDNGVQCSGLLGGGLSCDNGVQCSGLLGGGLSCNNGAQCSGTLDGGLSCDQSPF